MKFGIMNAVRLHPDKPYPIEQVYADYVGDGVRAEELGLDFSWYGEHHFRACQWTPSPFLVCAAVAAKTERLRVGTAVICLPFHNPLRVAEDAATLDALSGGRLDLGFGVGSQYEEFRSFRVNSNERVGRLWEAADLIERCFTSTQPFSHKGKYYDFPEVDFTTKPVQSRVPFWIGAMGPKNVERTAQRGWNLLSGLSTPFDAALRAKGRDPADFGVAPAQMVCVADNTEEAWQTAEDGLSYALNFYAQRRPLDGSGSPPGSEITKEMLRTLPPDSRWSPIVGDPDQVLVEMLALCDGTAGRFTHIPMAFRHAGMTTDAVTRSMELFAQEVLPALGGPG
jgi:alkanesulfonate monooxygenase SsuD/methylene tetrahydromethanopterin reductase-like flavin-dependent oxidoreductase (luciferase family)